MAWTTGLRGDTLEQQINLTNELYRAKSLALVQKIPTPITPVRLDAANRSHLAEAYFEKKGTVDYIGAAQGTPICFDAKETARASLPLYNVHAHQVAFMRDFVAQGGAAFLIVHFRMDNATYLLPFETLAAYDAQMRRGGRKSIPRAAFDEGLRIHAQGGAYLHYLAALDIYLQSKNKQLKR